MPSSTCAAASTNRASCTTLMRQPGSRLASNFSRRSRPSGTSAPAEPAQQASGWMAPNVDSTEVSRLFTADGGSVATFAPGPSTSATMRPPAHNRARLLDPPISRPRTDV
jgi:hypothetical protein